LTKTGAEAIISLSPQGGIVLIRLFLFPLIALLAAPVVIPAERSSAGAMPFLKLGVGAEAIGMGEAVTALTGDLFSSYWNPAGLSFVQQGQIGLMHCEWFEGINHEFAGYAHPLGDLGALSLTVNYVSYGELERRDKEGKRIGTFRPYDLAVGLSIGLRLTESLSCGLTGKWATEVIDESKGKALSADLGLIYSPPGTPISIGMLLQNLGTKAKFAESEFELPRVLKAGVAYRSVGGNIVLAADLQKPSDDSASIGIGIGLRTLRVLTLRAGYRYKLGGNDLGAISGLRVGLGVSVEGYQFDYAFATYGELGATHRFSVLARF